MNKKTNKKEAAAKVVLDAKFKDYPTAVSQMFYRQAKQEERERIVKIINICKEADRKSTGNFKYDSCYDDIINLINKE